MTMKHFNTLARCLTLVLAAAMLSGMLAVAEPAVQPVESDAPSYDIIYSASNPIPDIAEATRPAIVQLNTKQESWDPITRVAEVVAVGGGSACYIRAIDGEETQIVTHHQMMVDMKIMEAAFESDRTHMPVEVDLQF